VLERLDVVIGQNLAEAIASIHRQDRRQSIELKHSARLGIARRVRKRSAHLVPCSLRRRLGCGAPVPAPPTNKGQPPEFPVERIVAPKSSAPETVAKGEAAQKASCPASFNLT